MYDPMGYAAEPLIISVDAVPILQMLDQPTPISSVELALQITGEAGEANNVLEFIRLLDMNGYLNSPSFHRMRNTADEEFREMKVRPARCAGTAYPAEKQSLIDFCAEIFHNPEYKNPSEVYPETLKPEQSHRSPRALIMPHIDPRVGKNAYTAALQSLVKAEKPELIVFFATSHYGWQDQFIMTDKDFETPLGITRTDKSVNNRIRQLYAHELTPDDTAHRPEHSIELDLILLQYLFGAEQFTIVPVLITSFAHYIQARKLPGSYPEITGFAQAVYQAVQESGKKTLYISSGDLAHFGNKFGDQQPAHAMMSQAQQADEILLDTLAAANPDTFFNAVAATNDIWRICGCPPNYMLLHTIKPASGDVLCYECWDERERNSAVSYCTVAYY
jgi:AmmeMemoRadiSam system protein B